MDEKNPQNNRSLVTFFRYLCLGFLITAFRIDFGLSLEKIVHGLLINYAFSFVSGIQIALAAMVTTDLYLWIKKKGHEITNYRDSSIVWTYVSGCEIRPRRSIRLDRAANLWGGKYA